MSTQITPFFLQSNLNTGIVDQEVTPTIVYISENSLVNNCAISVKPSMELYSKVRPSMELYSKVRPSMELYSKVRPSMELYSKNVSII